MKKIAVYGTLRKGFSNHEFFLQGLEPERVALTRPEFTMFAAGIPFVVEGGTQAITVEVYSVDEDTLEGLDFLEGHPTMYKRTPIQLEDGSPVEMYIYQVGEQVKSGDYSQYEGARKHVTVS